MAKRKFPVTLRWTTEDTLARFCRQCAGAISKRLLPKGLPHRWDWRCVFFCCSAHALGVWSTISTTNKQFWFFEHVLMYSSTISALIFVASWEMMVIQHFLLDLILPELALRTCLSHCADVWPKKAIMQLGN